MPLTFTTKKLLRAAVGTAFASCIAPLSALGAPDSLPVAQQNALVHKYCAVCHTDAARNGGLSLEHYDAGKPNPALAAMLLSKLRNGAVGAAGLGIPDKSTGDAWIAATTAQAEGSGKWTVTRTETPGTNVLIASLVREVAPRKPTYSAPVYRLTLTCNLARHEGEMQLSWSPDPQTNRTFSVISDSRPAIPQKVEGNESMGNGTAGTSGRAAAMLSAPLPQTTLTIRDLFAGEEVVFPVGDLNKEDRQDLVPCFPPDARH